ncbi:MAG: HEPN domain-containing protein [Albidovulum sp.]|nr:HEPN domain-containing protein [Albidovulum sp.]
MSTDFSVIVDEFESGLVPLEEIVGAGQTIQSSPKARVASIHAATLLLAAEFEEFVREMARQFARRVVSESRCVSDLPDALLETAWRRTFDQVAKHIPSAQTKKEALTISARQARLKINALCSFVEGDINQDIFEHLIHNENNMRARQINSLFKVGGLTDVCKKDT